MIEVYKILTKKYDTFVDFNLKNIKRVEQEGIT